MCVGNYMYVCIVICMLIYEHVNGHIKEAHLGGFMALLASLGMYICVDIYIYVCVYIRMCVGNYMYVCIVICMFTYNM
jgi:hypothetical protein